MAITIVSSKNIVRADSTELPIISTTGIDDIGYLKVSDWLYVPLTDDMPLQIPNRSLDLCALEARNINFETLSVSTGITHASGTVERTTNQSYGGGYFNTALDGDSCSIQAKITSTGKLFGISLQDQSGPIVHDIDTNDTVAHAMIFGQNGLGSIKESGQSPPSNAYFKYDENDTALIELIGGIVRYFLIKPDGSMRLIRSTRSKLTEDPKGEAMVFYNNTQLENVYFWNGEKQSTFIEAVGVLENFQDWFNDYAWVSTADALELANKQRQFTYPSTKTRLRTLTANLNMRTKDDRIDYVDFFLYHGMEKEFLFVDIAHKDRDGNPTEFWALFTSPFGDKIRNSCLSAHAASITESYRNDYVPKILTDIFPPTTITDLEGESDGGIVTLDWTPPTDS